MRIRWTRVGRRVRGARPDHGGVVVVDDRFPDLLTGFRVAEFSWLLRQDVVAAVLTTDPELDRHLSEFEAGYPDLAGRVLPYDADRLPGYELAYAVFLDNACTLLPDLGRTGVPLVAELYPGGGLRLGTDETDERVRGLVASPLLAGVITTQPRVTEFLRSLPGPTAAVTEILGVVVNESYLRLPDTHPPYFGGGKDHLDVLFAAHRYDPQGTAKGYPTFVEACRLLVAAGLPVRVHVVGGHSADDVPLGTLGDRTSFHGALPTEAFQGLAGRMDLVISPNRPFVVRPGVWDGFPTGSCVEAALCGAAVVASDELGQNRLFTDGQDLLLVRPDAEEICARVQDLVAAEGGIGALAERGRHSFRTAYGVDAQMETRARTLRAALEVVRRR